MAIVNHGIETGNAGAGNSGQGFLLSLGAEGAEVKKWQEYLMSQGYGVTASGVFDNLTQTATRTWQKNNGLERTGSVNADAYALAGLKVGEAEEFDTSNAETRWSMEDEATDSKKTEPSDPTTPTNPTTTTTPSSQTEKKENPKVPHQLKDPNPQLTEQTPTYGNDYVNGDSKAEDHKQDLPPQLVDPNPNLGEKQETAEDPKQNLPPQVVDPNPELSGNATYGRDYVNADAPKTEDPAAKLPPQVVDPNPDLPKGDAQTPNNTPQSPAVNLPPQSRDPNPDLGNVAPTTPTTPTKSEEVEAPPMTYEEFLESETEKPGTSDVTKENDKETADVLAGLDQKADRPVDDQTVTPYIQGDDEGYEVTTDTTENGAGSNTEVSAGTSTSTDGTSVDPTMTESTRQAEYDALLAFANEKYNSDIALGQEVFDKLVAALTENRGTDLAIANDIKAVLDSLSQETYDKIMEYAGQKKTAEIDYAENNYSTTIDYITKTLEDGIALAEDQKAILLSMSNAERDAVYLAAAERLQKDTEYHEDAFDKIKTALDTQLATGKTMSDDIYNKDVGLAAQLKQNAESAKAAYDKAVADADRERERSVIDARNSYEQSLATYGSKAEQMASMGLNASGYSAYLDNQAYAMQRAETQAANAQAAGVKREAGYVQSEAERQAEAEYLQRMHQADINRINRNYEIDTTYQTNLLGAESERDSAIYNAQREHENKVLGADSAHRQNQYTAESNYTKDVADANRKYEDGFYAANLERDAAEHNANMEYNETATQAGLDKIKADAEANATHKQSVADANKAYNEGMTNAEIDKMKSDKAAADAKRETETSSWLDYLEGTRNESTQATRDFASLLEGVNSGSYTKEQALQLARDLGLSEDQIRAIEGAADDYAASVEEAEQAELDAAEAEHQEIVNGISSQITSGTTAEEIEDLVDQGVISEEEGDQMIAQRDKMLDEELDGFIKGGDMASFEDAIEQAYMDGRISKDAYQNKYYEAFVYGIKHTAVGEDLSILLGNLATLAEDGKIAERHVNEARKAIVDKFSKHDPNITVEIYSPSDGNSSRNIKFSNGKEYGWVQEHGVDRETSFLLNMATENKAKEGSFVVFNNNLYAYSSGKWNRIEFGGTSVAKGTIIASYQSANEDIPHNSTTVLEREGNNDNKF